MPEPGRNLSENGQVMRRNRQTGEWENAGTVSYGRGRSVTYGGNRGFANSLRSLSLNNSNTTLNRVNNRINRNR